jgi:hypothetical protein
MVLKIKNKIGVLRMKIFMNVLKIIKKRYTMKLMQHFQLKYSFNIPLF